MQTPVDILREKTPGTCLTRRWGTASRPPPPRRPLRQRSRSHPLASRRAAAGGERRTHLGAGTRPAPSAEETETPVPVPVPSLTGFTMALLPDRRRFELYPPIRVTSLVEPFPSFVQWEAASRRMRKKPSSFPYGFTRGAF